MLFIVALPIIWVLLAVGLMRLSVPFWAAIALGFSGAVVAGSSVALDGTLPGAVLFGLVLLTARRRYDLRLR